MIFNSIVFTPSFELLTLITTGHNVNVQDEKQVLSIFTSLETLFYCSNLLMYILVRDVLSEHLRKSHEEEFRIRMDTT